MTDSQKTKLNSEFQNLTPRPDELLPEDAGWPGDGSGTDDFADYNQNEADDYQDE